MKRSFLLLTIFLTLGLRIPVMAQNATTAAAIAEKQDTEEHFKRLTADLENLQSANAALQKKFAALEEEISKLREEQTRAASNTSAQEDLKRLPEKIQEVDKKREADRDLILSQLKKLGETLAAPSPRGKKNSAAIPDESSPHSSSKSADAGSPEKGYPYTVQDGDTLGVILRDLNAQFKSKGMKSITMKQVMAANPTVDWNRLRIGQKIFIPAPPQN